MRLTIACVGRAKPGDERRLAERYLDRATAAGRAGGLAVSLREIPEGKARNANERKAEEGQALRALLGPRDVLFLFDERGESLESVAFAGMIRALRDQGATQLVLAIGGPDGHDDALRSTARQLVAFGAFTWPHQLVRVLACEQIYRAATILTGHPYHRA